LTYAEARQFAKITTDGVLRSSELPSHLKGEDTFSQRQPLANNPVALVREKRDRRHDEYKRVETWINVHEHGLMAN